MAYDDSQPSVPGIQEFVMENGKILKDSFLRLYRFNSGWAYAHLRPYLKRLKYGPTPFEFEWDLLVVLDTCRPDALEAVADEYDWLPSEIETTRSCSSWSRDWMVKSFGEEWESEKAKTAHITWNAFSKHVLDAGDWLLLDEVWRVAWDEKRGWVPPGAVTDRAIHAGRQHHPERMIVHYQQPHAPYPDIETEGLPASKLGTVDNGRWTVWDRLTDTNDEIDRQTAWDAYLNNLRWALDHVEILLENVDADRVLLTADHGESFGELSIWGHGQGMPFPKLITVPKVWLTAEDTNSRQPDANVQSSEEVPDEEIADRLEALGYR